MFGLRMSGRVVASDQIQPKSSSNSNRNDKKSLS